jgi:hypothetical protein
MPSPFAVRLRPRGDSGSPQKAQTLRARARAHPTLRANLFPEVTDLFCRLPLSTLFYRLEAANLGDLLRL